MLRGGAVAFGPKPRDFSTKLPRKIYDLAWRTALSYRYRRGQLVVMEGEMDVENPDPALVLSIMRQNGWGHADGRSTLVVAGERPGLEKAMEGLGRDGRVLAKEEVDVKDIVSLLLLPPYILYIYVGICNILGTTPDANYSWKWDG